MGFAALYPSYVTTIAVLLQHPPHFPFSPAIFSIRFASTAQYVAGRKPLQQIHKPRVVAIRMRGLVFLDPGG